MSEESGKLNPCIRCGACCAHFRVAFYWREAEPAPGGKGVHAGAEARAEATYQVPPQLTVDLDDVFRCMKGTESKRSRGCVALKGRVGSEVACSIYENRPSPCRSFTASYADGKHHQSCDDARLAHGLKPLRREDWLDLAPAWSEPLANAGVRRFVSK